MQSKKFAVSEKYLLESMLVHIIIINSLADIIAAALQLVNFFLYLVMPPHVVQSSNRFQVKYLID